MMTTMPFFYGKTKKKPKPFNPNSVSYQGKDSREGRLHEIKTDRGNFRIKENRKDE